VGGERKEKKVEKEIVTLKTWEQYSNYPLPLRKAFGVARNKIGRYKCNP
jgi:hypothetical protein